MDETITSMNSFKTECVDTVKRLQVCSTIPCTVSDNLLSRIMTSCLAAQTDGQCLHHDRAYPEKQNNNFGHMLQCNN